MRPRRLVLEGFASFRERVEVDFSDADLFVLVGPTGAGKSSIIDAMTFALYGTVSRYLNKALVWPVISQGLNEARVQLDFTVGNATYSAVRVVKRTGANSASTKAATLEDATGRTLASNPDDLSDAVERLIGLPFDHFTRCVVLPQGDFAAFLHARSSERQELLVQLLGLDIYERIAHAANQRGAIAAAQVAVIDQQLATQFATVTEEALRVATERADTLAALIATIDAAKPALDEAAAERERATKAAQDAAARAKRLDDVAIPAGIERLAKTIAETTRAQASASTALEEATRAREEADRSLERAGSRGGLEALREKHGRRAVLDTDVAAAAQALERYGVAAQAAQEALDGAEQSHREADERFQQLTRDRAAAHLAEHLVEGQACPVCLQEVHALPAHEPAPDLEQAKQARQRAETARNHASKAANAAAQSLAGQRARADALAAQLQALLVELAHQLEPDAVAEALNRVTEAERARDAARAAEAEALHRHKQAKQAAADAGALEKRARSDLNQACLALAALSLTPPSVGELDLHEGWTRLVRWAREQSEAERATERLETSAAQNAGTRLQEKARELTGAAEVLGIRAALPALRDAAADAHAAARARADTLARELERAAQLRADGVRLEAESAVAKDLGKLLNASNFERWLMNRALRVLVDDATHGLHGLSAGAYSLALDDKNEFLVIDHRNADEKRMARTLSGGETFLASLALALALADHVAELASGGAARLEALFLDEGFGTLDATTLDTVAAALEELGSRGRMVGLVTHVRELADRMPVRFEVRKVGSVSNVDKVLA